MKIHQMLERGIIDELNGCWEWQGRHTAKGYGQFKEDGKYVYVHRRSHEIFIGPIPPKHDVHHKCENPGCWNPEHLQALARLDHILAGHRAGQPTCKRGHEFTPENTRMRGKWRICRKCHALGSANRRKLQAK